MSLPKRDAWLYGWFARYVRWKLKRRFASVEAWTAAGGWRDLLGAEPGVAVPGLEGRAVLVALTHPSWWDPLAAVAVEHGVSGLRGRAGYAAIEAEMLERYRVFQRLGFFGVEKDAASGAKAFLRTGRAVLTGTGAERRALWVTVAGRFHDPRERPVPVATGAAALLRRCRDAACLPVVLDYPSTNTAKARLCVGIGEPLTAEEGGRLPSVFASLSDALAEQVVQRRRDEA